MVLLSLQKRKVAAHCKYYPVHTGRKSL